MNTPTLRVAIVGDGNIVNAGWIHSATDHLCYPETPFASIEALITYAKQQLEPPVYDVIFVYGDAKDSNWSQIEEARKHWPQVKVIALSVKAGDEERALSYKASCFECDETHHANTKETRARLKRLLDTFARRY